MKRLFRWWRDRQRTSWIYCPKCRHDLNGDGYSFAQHGIGDHLAYYECAKCGFRSKFDLDAPVPIYIGEWWKDGFEWPTCWDSHPTYEECPQCTRPT